MKTESLDRMAIEKVSVALSQVLLEHLRTTSELEEAKIYEALNAVGMQVALLLASTEDPVAALGFFEGAIDLHLGLIARRRAGCN